jgi:hypothetical protein
MIEVPSGPIDPIIFKKPIKQLTGEAKWRDIEDLINRWARRNPWAAKDLEAYVKEKRPELTDKKHGLLSGMSKGDINAPATRIGVAIHPELMNYIQAFYPEFMDDKKDLYEFKKRFPKFRITEAI